MFVQPGPNGLLKRVRCQAITGVMSYQAAIQRVQQLETMIEQLSAPLSASGSVATPGSSSASFNQVLGSAQSAVAGSAVALPQAGGGSNPGLAAVQAAETQVGVTEQPPGSNNGPAISMYRSAVAGSYAGAPWCAYFVSWAARQAGVPLGSDGQGLGSVAEITQWAQQTGRFTTTPAPGELILFGTAHVGIVKSVNPNGTLTTIEGNYANSVQEVTRWPSEATGYVRL